MSTRSSLKIGFIGGGIDSAVGYTHFVASRMDNRWELVSGCYSIDPDMNEKTGRAYGTSPDRVYGKWQDMLINEKGILDAIAVLTPTPTHFNIVKACLNKGIPVLCEKALVLTSNEADELKRLLRAKKGFLAVTYNYSSYPMARELRQKIRKGLLGKILHFQAEIPQEGYIRLDSKGKKMIPQEWRLIDRKVPTLHLDLAVHLHQLINYLTDLHPTEVISNQDSLGFFPNVIDNVHCLCRYNKGVQGQLWFSKSSLGHRNGLRIRIFGSNASAEWYQANPEELLISYKDGKREIVDRASNNIMIANQQRYCRFKAGHPAGFIEAFANLYCDIAQCLKQYKSAGKCINDDVYGIDIASEGLRMIEAMVKSSQIKRWQIVG